MSETILSVAVLIISASLHEAAHGYAALWLGDPTAKLAGRLTMNPLRHLDPLGSVLVPAILAMLGSPILFGWAKPVPYNPYNLTNRRWGEALVAVAGPLSNILLAGVFAIAFRIGAMSLSPALATFFGVVVLVNLALAAFNLMPIPPLDGSKILASFFGQRGRAFLSMPFAGSLIFVLIVAYALWPIIERWVLIAASFALGG